MIRRRVRDEGGYAAILVSLLLPTVFVGMAAIGVDVSRWYAAIAQVQKAADAAAMAGVTYMPLDLPEAREVALETAARNGFTNVAPTTITVSEGARPSQLRVTISSPVANSFGAALGVDFTRITRTAVADYTAPAPMGSPCNTFGNEPPSSTGAAPPAGSALPSTPFPNCQSHPRFWAAIEGPRTDKIQGDRYMTLPCETSGTHGCDDDANLETRPEGYFFAIRVEEQAVGAQLDVQIYDPAYVETNVNCNGIDQTYVIGRMNQYETTNGTQRFDNASSIFCSGDYNPGGASGPPPDTSFTMRQQTDTGDPMRGAVITGCTKQFRGVDSAPREALRQWTTAAGSTPYNGYEPERARTFHQWVSLCKFTPTRAGDYYLQVRTNVALGGSPVANVNASNRSFTPVVYEGNTAVGAAVGNHSTGVGLNSFSLRAVPSSATMRSHIAVAGYSRMPILQNASSSTATFNLIRALPGTKGQYVSFDFFDAADGSTTSGGKVKVLPPVDATGSIKASTGIPGCKGALGSAAFAPVTACTVPVRSGTHNGKVQRMVIPLPTDYNCDPSNLGGCWFRIEVNFSGSDVTDFTTWDANIGGDPVRLIE